MAKTQPPFSQGECSMKQVRMARYFPRVKQTAGGKDTNPCRLLLYLSGHPDLNRGITDPNQTL